MPRPSHSSWFYHRIILAKQYISWSPLLRGLLQSPVTSSLLGPNILLNNTASNTVSLCFSFNVRDQVSHPSKTAGKTKLCSLYNCVSIS
jgi:hypothetical protein